MLSSHNTSDEKAATMTDLKDLTTHLLELHPDMLQRATEHPFLKAAGSGMLPTRKLRDWLAQDVHYTRGYVRFVGGLMSRLKLEWEVFEGPPSLGDDRPVTLQHRVFNLLADAIVNIRREMAFFQSTDENYQLGVTTSGRAKQARATRGYVELFEQWTGHGSGSHHWQPQSVDQDGPDEQTLYGLVCLWATEMVYLRAWSYAAKVMKGDAEPALEKLTSKVTTPSADDSTLATATLHEQFIPNWSSPEFGKFVDRCAQLTDDVAKELDRTLAKSSDAKRTVVLENCRSVYLSILELEESFWPNSRRQSAD